MGKKHKKHKKHKHSKHKHKSKGEEYYVPVVPLKSDFRPKQVTPVPIPSESEVGKSIGPVLPPSLSNLKNNKSSMVSVPAGEQNDSYGPSLPPHLVPQKRVPGPSLPSDFKIKEKTDDDNISGFGPLPAELITSDSEQVFIQKQLELRAEYMKRKFAGEVCTPISVQFI